MKPRTDTTCAVRGVLENGRAICGRHRVGGGCSAQPGTCEHQQQPEPRTIEDLLSKAWPAKVTPGLAQKIMAARERRQQNAPRKICLSCGRRQEADGTLACGH